MQQDLWMIAKLHGNQPRMYLSMGGQLGWKQSGWKQNGWTEVKTVMDESEDAIGCRRPCHIYWVMSLSECEGSCLGVRHICPELGWYNTPASCTLPWWDLAHAKLIFCQMGCSCTHCLFVMHDTQKISCCRCLNVGTLHLGLAWASVMHDFTNDVCHDS